jgi:hypothetical protein
MKLQFAIGSFLVLLGAVELWEWLKERTLPTPLLLLGAAVLAVVSNYSKLPIEALLGRLTGAGMKDLDGE